MANKSDSSNTKITKGKVYTLTDTRHCWVERNSGNIVVTVAEQHVQAYLDEGVDLFKRTVTKTVDGVKIDTVQHLVNIKDEVKRTVTRAKVTDKLIAKVDTIDFTGMSSDEIRKAIATALKG